MDFLTLSTQTTRNIGDEIQIIAAEGLLKKNNIAPSAVIDRERLSTYSGPKAKLIMNGWYFHESAYWPPSKHILPLISSFHLTDVISEVDGTNPRATALKKSNLPFLLENGPIGARDIEVLEFLTAQDIPAYFSGCMTLTIEPKGVKKINQICCIDASPEMIDHIKKVTEIPVIELHNSDIPDGLTRDEKMQLGQERLNTYEASTLVISSRLHAVLPALSLGTPALLIHNKNADASRYAGLKELVRNCSEDDFIAGLFNYLLIKPTDNSSYYAVIKKNLENIVHQFINNDPLPLETLLKISQENLRTLLVAKEDNDRAVAEWHHSLTKRQNALVRAAKRITNYL